MDNKKVLALTMACLLYTTRDTTLGKLLDFCLAAKVEARRSGKTPLAFAEELLDKPEIFADWIGEVIDSDDVYTRDEMMALSGMDLKDVEEFMQMLFEELNEIAIDG